MNHAKRSLELQRRIMAVTVELERLKRERLRLKAMLETMTPKRPFTGCSADIMRILTESERPLTAREIADMLPHRDRQRVRVMVHQQARWGRVERIQIGGSRHNRSVTKYAFKVKANA